MSSWGLQVIAASLSFAALAACASAPPAPRQTKLDTRPVGALRSTDADSAACLSQGHPIGTDGYARCLLRQAEERRGAIWRGAAPAGMLKLGDWCWSATTTAAEPFRCLDI